MAQNLHRRQILGGHMKKLERLIGFFERLYDDISFVARIEFKNIFNDKGVMAVFFGAMLLYPLLYAYTYSKEVVKEIPVAVVDQSHSAMSRQLIRMLNQTEQVKVVEHLTGLEEAEKEFYYGRIRGIMLIPSDFEKKILRGEQTTVSAYCDASYFMLYKQVYKGVVLAAGTMSAGVEIKRLEAKGLSESAAKNFRDPVPCINYPLFSPAGGYASYAMPAIFLVLLQQTLMMGIGILGGTALERGSYRYLISKEIHSRGVLAILIGKLTPYFVLYSIHGIYLFGILFKIFGYSQRGNIISLAYFLFTYLLSVMAMGFAITPFFKHRETAIATIMSMSLPFVLSARFSWPSESIPAVIKFLAAFVPSTSGISGFLKITQMGASIQGVRGDLATLWGLVALYGTFSMIMIWRILGHHRRRPML